MEVVFARGTTEPPGVGGVGQAFVDSLSSKIGGFSQGAAVIDMARTDLPPDVSGHVAAVADFGGPRTLFADGLSPGPLPAISPLCAGKMIDMCVPNDPICFEGGWDMSAHNAYIQTGRVDDAAAYAAGRL
ncbi:cutinase family protein [Mycolicibacterium septicum]|uniref:cutinase family protein n=1 Tax=Mycolicibacterium septicum TaxID=98668 RepID=UPI0023E20FC8|nr:cutinase family protein [Mycolicibacterium septicum]MDF3341743.1 cutinase family protein [Mycolicibacterium septicum]